MVQYSYFELATFNLCTCIHHLPKGVAVVEPSRSMCVVRALADVTVGYSVPWNFFNNSDVLSLMTRIARDIELFPSYITHILLICYPFIKKTKLGSEAISLGH
jgi:hypothetical protein